MISGIFEPLGVLVAGLLFQSFLTEFVVNCLLASVGGIMTLISFLELIPSALLSSPAHDVNTSIFAGMFVCCLALGILTN